MTYVVRDKTQLDGHQHEVTDVSDSGNYVTKCQQLITNTNAFVSVGVGADCPNCLNPPVVVEVVRTRKPRDPDAKPQWRTARNRHAEMIQGLQFAHKAIVAAIEWAQRGSEQQFLNDSLDQTHLGYRFLKEILSDYDRIQDDTPPDTE